MFAYHLLLPDLQMYILAKRPDLLSLAPRLSKSFYQRAQPFLYQEFYYKRITHSEVLNYLLTHQAPQWRYVESASYPHVAWIYERVLVDKTYLRQCLYELSSTYPPPPDYHLSRPSPHLEFAFDDNFLTWSVDFITLEQVLLNRSLCSRRDPNYIKNYLLNYLSQLRSNRLKKMHFYMYLVLNFQVYGLKLDLQTEVDDLDREIKKLYQELVSYLQKK